MTNGNHKIEMRYVEAVYTAKAFLDWQYVEPFNIEKKLMLGLISYLIKSTMEKVMTSIVNFKLLIGEKHQQTVENLMVVVLEPRCG